MRDHRNAIVWAIPLVIVAVLATGCGVTIETGKSCQSSYTMGLSPDGRTMAVSVPDPDLDHIFLVRLNGGHSRQLTTTDCDGYPSWSPDGTQIALIKDDFEISVVDAASGLREDVSGSQLARNSIHWTSNGALVYGIEDKDGIVGDWSYFVGQLPVGGGNAIRLISKARFPSLTADETRIAYVSDNLNDVYVAPYPFGQPAQHLEHNDDDTWDVAWSPDGRWIALDTARGIRILDPTGTNSPIVWTRSAYRPVWAHDSRHLYSLSGSKLFKTDLYGRDRRYVVDLSTLPATGG